jgi:hypothetical protein
MGCESGICRGNQPLVELLLVLVFFVSTTKRSGSKAKAKRHTPSKLYIVAANEYPWLLFSRLVVLSDKFDRPENVAVMAHDVGAVFRQDAL